MEKQSLPLGEKLVKKLERVVDFWEKFFPLRWIFSFLITALIFLAVLQILDVLSTLLYVQVSGIENELNPLGRLIYINYGEAGLWLSKFIVFALMLAVSSYSLYSMRKYPNERRAYIAPIIIFLVCSFLDLTLFVTTFINLAL